MTYTAVLACLLSVTLSVSSLASETPAHRAGASAIDQADDGQDRDAVEVGEGIVAPRVMRDAKPAYTKGAMDAGIQGAVVMKVVVRKDSTVGRVDIVQSLDDIHGLDDEAVKAVRKWSFAPGTKNKQAVAVRVTIEMSFTMKK